MTPFEPGLTDCQGNGIINVDGELWKIQRKAGAQFFTGASIDSLVENELPQHFAKMRRTMLEAASTSSPVDLQALFFDLTTATMGRLAYGMDIDASSAFATLFDYASGKTGERFQNPLYPLTERFTGARFRAAVSEVHKFGKEIVSQAETRLNRVRNGESGISISKPATGSTLIELLLTKLDDRRIVADSALNFLSAARDTTAQALTWTFYCLMRNPHIVLQIRRELGERLQSVSTPQDLTTSLLQPQSLPYLHAVFNEALRLFPPIPFEIKQCMADAMLPDGTFLPKGSVVFWSIWSMNRSKEIWGDYDPVNEYIPERWINNSTANGEEGRTRVFKGRSAFEFPVFNGGPRACLGRKMAELMAVWVIAKMVAEFDFKELSGLKDVAEDRRKTTKMNGDHGGANAKLPPRRTKNSLTLPMEGGLPCLLTELRSH